MVIGGGLQLRRRRQARRLWRWGGSSKDAPRRGERGGQGGAAATAAGAASASLLLFKDLTVDNDLPPVERVVRYVRSGITLQRLVHVKMLVLESDHLNNVNDGDKLK